PIGRSVHNKNQSKRAGGSYLLVYRGVRADAEGVVTRDKGGQLADAEHSLELAARGDGLLDLFAVLFRRGIENGGQGDGDGGADEGGCFRHGVLRSRLGD